MVGPDDFRGLFQPMILWFYDHSIPLHTGQLQRVWSLFTRSHVEKTRGNRYKLHQDRFYLDL